MRTALACVQCVSLGVYKIGLGDSGDCKLLLQQWRFQGPCRFQLGGEADWREMACQVSVLEE